MAIFASCVISLTCLFPLILCSSSDGSLEDALDQVDRLAAEARASEQRGDASHLFKIIEEDTPRRTEPIVAARKKLKDRGLRDPVPDFPKKVPGESPDDRERKLQDFISGKTQDKHKFTPGMQSRHNLFVV